MTDVETRDAAAPPWFKLWPARILSDARIARLDERMQRRLLLLFCLQAAGHTPSSDTKVIAWSLRLSVKELRRTVETLSAECLLREDYTSPLFEDMQRVKDPRARDRMRNMRERRSSSVTSAVTTPVTLRPQDRGERIEAGASAFTALVAPALEASSRDSLTVARGAAPPGSSEGPGRGLQQVGSILKQSNIRRNR
jgi:hypothetical protein